MELPEMPANDTLKAYIVPRYPWLFEVEGQTFERIEDAAAYSNTLCAPIYCRLALREKAANE